MSVIRQIINGAKIKFTFFINSITATGGTKVFLDNKIYHIFTQPGTFEITSVPIYNTSTEVNYLIAAAGGSSGPNSSPATFGSGGGGAGGLRIGTYKFEIGTYPVTVGTGGPSNGGNSSVFSLTSNGGGRGTGGTAVVVANGAPFSGIAGGCGGGAGTFGFTTPVFNPAYTTASGGTATQPPLGANNYGNPGGSYTGGSGQTNITIPAAASGGGGGGAGGQAVNSSKSNLSQTPSTAVASGGNGYSSPSFPYQIGQIANLPSDWITSILTYGFCKGGDATGPFPTPAMIGTTNTGNGGQGNNVAGSPGIVIISYDVYNSYNDRKTL